MLTIILGLFSLFCLVAAIIFFIQNEKSKANNSIIQTSNLEKSSRITELQYELDEKENRLVHLQAENTRILSTSVSNELHNKQISELKENHKQDLVDIIESLKSKYVTKDQVDQVETLLKDMPKIVKEQIRSDVTGDTSALAQTTKNMLKQIDELRASVSESSTKNEHWLRPIHSFAENFNNVLYNSRKRGRLGEITLANILESAGLKRNISFFEQARSDENEQIVDFKIQLPEGQNLVVDSKFPLDNWNAYLAANEDNRKAKMEAHIKDIQTHIRKLNKAAYHRAHHSTLNKTIMFLSIDEALNLAYEMDPNLKIYAEQNEVILLSPSSLIPFLELAHIVILANKRDAEIDRMIEIVQSIYEEAVKFHEQMHGLKGIVTNLVTELNGLHTDYNEGLYPQLQQLHELETLQSKRAKRQVKNTGQVTNLKLKPLPSTRQPDNWETA